MYSRFDGTCLSCVAPICGNLIANRIDIKRSDTAQCNSISKQPDVELVSRQFNWPRHYAPSWLVPAAWYTESAGRERTKIERAREKIWRIANRSRRWTNILFLSDLRITRDFVFDWRHNRTDDSIHVTRFHKLMFSCYVSMLSIN